MGSDFARLVGVASGAQTHRVWSLLITVFGDLASAPGEVISGTVLKQISALTGIKPEATRVALHRLRKEGWLESRRNGRSSVYALTEWGRLQCAQAAPRIYRTEQAGPRAFLILTDPAKPSREAGVSGCWLTSGVLISAEASADDDQFSTELGPDAALPAWMTDRLCGPEMCSMSAEVALRLRALSDALDHARPLGPLQIAVLRVLIVHSWRRIILRAPALPDHVFPTGWRGAECRARAAALLTRLPAPRLDDLEQEARAS